MVHASAIVLAALVLSITGYCWWIYHKLQTPVLSGDTWYMRQFAYTDQPVSAPYRWRPLLPWLARWFGFKQVSFVANAATPFIVYYYAGGGWVGFCCAAMFVMNPHLFQFNVRNPEYAEGLGHCLFAGAIVAMSAGHWAAWPLFAACALTRETLTAALGLISLFTDPYLIAPLALGTIIGQFAREESQDNKHPLIEDTYYGTVARWAKHKGWKAFGFAHTILPLRGAPFAVPFVWERVGDSARMGLWGLLPIWLLSLPASGQKRVICYGFILFVPFLAALPIGWLVAVTILACFWPIDWNTYDERGDAKFLVASH